MGASTITNSATDAVAGVRDLSDVRSRFLKMQSDERLVLLTRRGNDGAFETLVERYRSRLLGFIRHMVNSTEDAEDLLQEVFAASYNAMKADERDLNVRPWFYRIARNRALNHLRVKRATGMDSMDIYESAVGKTTADHVHGKIAFQELVSDMHDLPETQRTALLMREMASFSYVQIAAAMDTTVPGVKSLLVRARIGLAEAAEARKLTCDEVRIELGAEAEGLKKVPGSVRRHVSDCSRCHAFRKELRANNKTLAAFMPLGPLMLVKKLFAFKLLGGGSAAGAGVGAGSAATGATTVVGVGATGATLTTGIGSGAISTGLSAGFGAVASKAAAGLAAAALVTTGAAQVKTVPVPAPHTAKAITTPLRAPAGAINGGTAATLTMSAGSAPVVESPAEETPVADPTPTPAEVPVPAETAPEVLPEEAVVDDGGSSVEVEPTPADAPISAPVPTDGGPVAPTDPVAAPTPPTSEPSPTPPTSEPTGPTPPADVSP